MKKKLSIGSWAYIFNQEQPTNDFHVVLHKLQDLGYDGVELGSFGVHPTPWSHPTKASRQKLKKEVADHGLEFSGIAVDLWSFKKPGPSILDQSALQGERLSVRDASEPADFERAHGNPVRPRRDPSSREPA